MRIKNGFMLREISDTFIVVPVGERSIDFNGMITLNESGAFLWKQLSSGKDVQKEELVEALINEYDIDVETATADIDEFLETLNASGIIE